MALVESTSKRQVKATTELWIDGNRTDTYPADGSIEYPYKTFSAAVTGMAAKAKAGYTLHVAYGIYTEAGNLTFGTYELTIFAHYSSLTVGGGTGTMTIAKAGSIYDLNLAGHFSQTGTGGLDFVSLYGCSFYGNTTTAGQIIFTNCGLGFGSVITLNSAGYNAVLENCAVLGRVVVGTNTTAILQLVSVITTDYSNYAITATASGSRLIMSSGLVTNNGTGGGINCSNTATSPNANDIVDVGITVNDTSKALTGGTAALTYSGIKIYPSSGELTPTGSNLLPTQFSKIYSASIWGGVTSSENLLLMPNSATWSNNNTGLVTVTKGAFSHNINESFTSTANVVEWAAMREVGTWTMDSSATWLNIPSFYDARRINYTGNQFLSSAATFNGRTVINATTNVTDGGYTNWITYLCYMTYQATVATASASSTPNVTGFHAMPIAQIGSGSHAGATLTVTNLDGFRFDNLGLINNINSAQVTVTNIRGFWAKTPKKHASGTITNQFGYDCDDYTTAFSTLCVAYRSQMTADTAKWSFYDSGGANNSFKGNTRFGDNTAPTTLVDIIGKMTITNAGLITKYNNIACVSNGVPSEYATVDLTGQTAAIGATTLYAVPAAGAGMYRVSFVAKVTTAATTSSTLGGTNGFRIVYTDQDDSVAVTTGNITNVSGATLTGNTTQIVYAGTMIVNAKASTNIQYSMDYTSVGATPMAYNLHIKLEAL